MCPRHNRAPKSNLGDRIETDDHSTHNKRSVWRQQTWEYWQFASIHRSVNIQRSEQRQPIRLWATSHGMHSHASIETATPILHTITDTSTTTQHNHIIWKLIVHDQMCAAVCTMLIHCVRQMHDKRTHTNTTLSDGTIGVPDGTTR